MTATGITNLEPYGDHMIGVSVPIMDMRKRPPQQYGTATHTYTRHGWQWDYTDPHTGTTRHFHTSYEGEGLFSGDRQSLGYGQFYLPAGRKAAYDKLRRGYRQEA